MGVAIHGVKGQELSAGRGNGESVKVTSPGREGATGTELVGSSL